MTVEYCSNAIQCPPSAPYHCADYTCQTSLDLCSSIVVCPPSILLQFISYSIAHKRIRNHCVIDIDTFLLKNIEGPYQYKQSAILCPDYLHWSYDATFCPSTLTCSNGYVLCDDNTCRKHSSECPIHPECPHYTCPFGTCVDNYEQCYTNIVCKRGYKLCSDRICHPRQEDCPSYVDEAHQLAFESNKKVCISGDIVEKNEVCPDMVLFSSIINQ